MKQESVVMEAVKIFPNKFQNNQERIFLADFSVDEIRTFPGVNATSNVYSRGENIASHCEVSKKHLMFLPDIEVENSASLSMPK
jgi:hypothetical protein